MKIEMRAKIKKSIVGVLVGALMITSVPLNAFAEGDGNCEIDSKVKANLKNGYTAILEEPANKKIEEKVTLPSGEQMVFKTEIKGDKVTIESENEYGEIDRVVKKKGEIFLNGEKIEEYIEEEVLAEKFEQPSMARAKTSVKWGKWSEGKSTVTKVHKYGLAAVAIILIAKSPNLPAAVATGVAIEIIKEKYAYAHIKVQGRFGSSKQKIGPNIKTFIHAGQKTTVSGKYSVKGKNHHVRTSYTSQKRPAK